MPRSPIIGLVASVLIAVPATAQVPPITGNTDPAFGRVGKVEIVASIPDFDPSGIAVIGGRLFLSQPKQDMDAPGPTLAEWRGGRIVPWPTPDLAMPSARPAADRLVSVHGLTTDTAGRLWALDDGKVKGKPYDAGGAKVIGFDPATGHIVAKLLLTDAMLPGSNMNDLRVDLTHGAEGTVYITDSSANDAALVVVDIATGRQRRVLAGDRSVIPDPGYMTVLDGRVLNGVQQPPAMPRGGADGITLSRDSSRLYYAPLSSRSLYSLPTALLADFATTDATLAAAVRDEGEKGAADGLATDTWGRIYTSASDHNAVFRRNLDGSFALIARDPRFVWPDGLFADDRYVYVTLGQWTRLPQFHNGTDMRRPPFLVARMPIVAP
ncbi:L-dopachrome tautomerase-related protein [Roseomonas gilardii]|uniref:L-dopachrome tautomerase-related protein n=1 Tax=Roseomonas gilardii TaxID=257708 RepID=UPI00119FCC94|nr:L-dopachrome tautomerase-related protein [Roseomonas gilardii]